MSTLTDRVHKAQPGNIITPNTYFCAVCEKQIKRVPGGNGPTWVHSDTGAVAAPYGTHAEMIRGTANEERLARITHELQEHKSRLDDSHRQLSEALEQAEKTYQLRISSL